MINPRNLNSFIFQAIYNTGGEPRKQYFTLSIADRFCNGWRSIRIIALNALENTLKVFAAGVDQRTSIRETVSGPEKVLQFHGNLIVSQVIRSIRCLVAHLNNRLNNSQTALSSSD